MGSSNNETSQYAKEGFLEEVKAIAGLLKVGPGQKSTRESLERKRAEEIQPILGLLEGQHGFQFR